MDKIKKIFLKDYETTATCLEQLQNDPTNEEEEKEMIDLKQFIDEFLTKILELKAELQSEQLENIQQCVISLERSKTATKALKKVHLKNCLRLLKMFQEDLKKPPIIPSPQTDNWSQLQMPKEDQPEEICKDDEQFIREEKLTQVKLKTEIECKQCITDNNKVKQEIEFKHQEALKKDEQQCLELLQLNKLEADWITLQQKIQKGRGNEFILVLGAEDSQTEMIAQYLADETVREGPFKEKLFCSDLTKQKKIVVCFPSFKQSLEKTDEEVLLSQRCLIEIQKYCKSVIPVVALNCEQIFQDKTCLRYIEFMYTKICQIFTGFDNHIQNLSIFYSKKVSDLTQKQIKNQQKKIINQLKGQEVFAKFQIQIAQKTIDDQANIFEIEEKYDQQLFIDKIESINQKNLNWKEALPKEFNEHQKKKITDFIQFQGKQSSSQQNSQNYELAFRNFKDQTKLFEIFQLDQIKQQQQEQKGEIKKLLKQQKEKFLKDFTLILQQQPQVQQQIEQKPNSQQPTQKYSQRLLTDILNLKEQLQSWQNCFEDSDLNVKGFYNELGFQLEKKIILSLQPPEVKFDNKIEQLVRFQQVNLITGYQYQQAHQQGVEHLKEHLKGQQYQIIKSLDSLFLFQEEKEEETFDKDQLTSCFNDKVNDIAKQFQELQTNEQITKQWDDNLSYFNEVQVYLNKKCLELQQSSKEKMKKVINIESKPSALLCKQQFLLLKSIRQHNNRLGFKSKDELIQVFINQKSDIQQSCQQIYEIIFNVINSINKNFLKNYKLDITQLQKLWELKFYIIEFSQIRELHFQISQNSQLLLDQITIICQEIVKKIGEKCEKELEISKNNYGVPNQQFLENMTALVQLNSWLDKILKINNVSEEYNKIVYQLIQQLNLLKYSANHEMEIQFKDNKQIHSVMIKKCEENFQKYYTVYFKLVQNPQNGQNYNLTAGKLIESHLEFMEVYQQKIIQLQVIQIDEQQNIQDLADIHKMYTELAKNSSHPLKEIYNIKKDEMEDKICNLFAQLAQNILKDSEEGSRKILLNKYKDKFALFQFVDKTSNLKYSYAQLEELHQEQINNNTNKIQIEVQQFLEKKEIDQLNQYADQLPREQKIQCQKQLQSYFDEQSRTAYQNIQQQQYLKAWEVFKFIDKFKLIATVSQSQCNQFKNEFCQKLNAAIESVLQKFDKFCQDKQKCSEIDIQQFFEITQIMADKMFFNDKKLSEKMESIQEKLYEKLRKFLADFNNEKVKLTNMDQILGMLEDMHDFINGLDSFKGNSHCLISKLLEQQQNQLPEFAKDLKTVFDKVVQVENEAKQQFTSSCFDQWSLSMEISRNSEKCSEYFKKSVTCAQYFKNRNNSHLKLIDYFINLIDFEFNEIKKLIKDKQFKGQLGKLLENLDSIIKSYNEDDVIKKTCSNNKREVGDMIINYLQSYQKDFTNDVKQYKNQPKQELIKQMCDYIFSGLEICDTINQFSEDVDKFITNCMEIFNKQLEGDDILQLSNCLQEQEPGTKRQIMAQQLLDKNPNFSYIANMNFNKEVNSTHKIEYILKGLKKFDPDQDEPEKINQQEEDLLSKNYLIYEGFKTEILEKYLMNQNRSQLLLNEIKETTGQFKAKQDDEDIKLKLLILLITQIFSLWQFFCIDNKMNISKMENAQKGLKFPHAAQIISVFIILGLHKVEGLSLLLQDSDYSINQNVAIECLTGQGKSLILAISAIVIVIVKQINIDIGCYSDHLTKRDEEEFKQLFQQLQVEQNIKYGTLLELAGNMMNQDGDIRQMCSNLVENDKISNGEQQKKKRGFLLDEYDTMGQENFFGDTYDATQIIKIPQIIAIQRYLWDNQKLKNQTLLQEVLKLNEYQTLTNKYKEWKELIERHIHLMIVDVTTMNTYKKDTDYFVKDKKIGYKMHDATINYDVSEGYKTVFAHFRERLDNQIPEEELNKVTGLNLVCGHFSYAELLKKYCFIKGVTGTIKSQHKGMRQLMKQYFPENYLIPSMFSSSHQIFDQASNVKIYKEKADHYLAIYNLAQEKIKNQQAVQIYFNSNVEILEFLQFTNGQKNLYLILDAQTEKKDLIIKESTRAGQISLIIRDFGRGTDYRVFDEIVKQKGGVVIIQVFFSIDKTEEIQIMGRTARQNNKGAYFLLLLDLDVSKSLKIHESKVRDYIDKPSEAYKYLDQIRMNNKREQIDLLIKAKELAMERHNLTLELQKSLNEIKIASAKDFLLQIGLQDLDRKCPIIILPYHFIFVIDISGSMDSVDYKERGNKKTRFQLVQESLNVFLRSRLQQTNGTCEDKISLITYNDKANILLQYQDIQENIIIQAQPDSSTYFHNAIKQVIQVIQKGKQEQKKLQNKILFLSDGGDMSEPEELYNFLKIINTEFKGEIASWWNRGFGPGSEVGVLCEMTKLLSDCNAEQKQILVAENLNQDFQRLANPRSIKQIGR